MYKSKGNIMEKIEPMLVGNALRDKMTIFPDYEESIRKESASVRLLELNKINSFYLPSDMSIEIYTKLYLAMVRSLQKKESKLAIQQRNLNGKRLRAYANGTETSFEGVIGGSDSFSIIGCSGIGKTTAWSKAVYLMGGEKIIEMENPFCKIIPVISVQCPFDCSAKSMLLAILQKVDNALGTNYYENMVRAKANINTMLISTAQVLLNHVAVLCIDEIQNLIKHRAGMQLVSMLTELLNESGISIVFVGTPEIKPFFESVDYLARRTLGLIYGKCEYNGYFKKFCNTLWKYQYVGNRTEITEGIVNWLYQHSSGTLAHVIFLFYTSQEISILDGREIIDIQALEAAYQRMEILHMHIQPKVSMKKIASKRKKNTSVQVISETTEKKEENAIASGVVLDVVEEHPASRGNSVLSRFYQNAGYPNYIFCAEDLFVNKRIKPDIEFINELKPEIIYLLCQNMSIEHLIEKHTMFPYYARFLPKERRIKGFEALCSMSGNFNNLLAVPKQKSGKERYLRYCPLCVKEDREVYEETYWHRSHQMMGVDFCPKHGCKLIDSSIMTNSKASPNLIPAELEVKKINNITYGNEKGEEHCYMLAMDIKNRILGMFFISKGTKNQSVVGGREVFMRALLVGASYIILCHNHPSEDCFPSKEDIVITKKFKDAGELIGVPVSDHIIVGGDTYFSFLEQEIL